MIKEAPQLLLLYMQKHACRHSIPCVYETGSNVLILCHLFRNCQMVRFPRVLLKKSPLHSIGSSCYWGSKIGIWQKLEGVLFFSMKKEISKSLFLAVDRGLPSLSQTQPNFKSFRRYIFPLLLVGLRNLVPNEVNLYIYLPPPTIMILICVCVCIENYLGAGVASKIRFSCYHVSVFSCGKKNRHVLADVSNAEASDVAHAATLLDPWLQKVPKKNS